MTAPTPFSTPTAHGEVVVRARHLEEEYHYTQEDEGLCVRSTPTGWMTTTLELEILGHPQALFDIVDRVSMFGANVKSKSSLRVDSRGASMQLAVSVRHKRGVTAPVQRILAGEAG